jgi:hypothetical protein
MTTQLEQVGSSRSLSPAEALPLTPNPQGQRILLQTTIPHTEDDWHVGRFSRLANALRGDGCHVTARDRGTQAGTDDPILTGLSRVDFDQLWLFAVDTGNGITEAECAAVADFRANGGAVFGTRDHQDVGSSVCSLAEIGAPHYFHTKQMPSAALRMSNQPFRSIRCGDGSG